MVFNISRKTMTASTKLAASDKNLEILLRHILEISIMQPLNSLAALRLLPFHELCLFGHT